MKRHPFRRALVAFTIYTVALLALTLVQFSRRTGFTLNVGSLVVSGRYAEMPDGKTDAPESLKSLDGSVTVIFGGMEMRLSEADGLRLITSAGSQTPAQASAFKVAGNDLYVYLSDQSSLCFQTAFSDGIERLSVSASLADGTGGLQLPFKPLRSSRLSKQENGRVVIVNGGNSYAFSQSTVDMDRKLISLSGGSAFSYGKVIEKKAASIEDLILAKAKSQETWDAAIKSYIGQSYAYWERTMAGTPNEASVVAWVSEARRRGSYRSATATTPASFLQGSSRTFRSSVYFGKLDEGLRTLASSERESLSRLSRLANEKNPELFLEPNLIFYTRSRASKTLSGDVSALAQGMDPASITPTVALGILESWADWQTYRTGEDNPFTRLTDQALFVLSGTFKQVTADLVLPVIDAKVDVLFALQSGAALARAGDLSGEEDKTGLGRSLILSALSFADQNGALPSSLSLEAGQPALKPGSSRISAAEVYPYIAPEDALPHAIAISKDIWVWTASKDVSAHQESGVLTINVKFAEGETHYLMVRGIKPFAKIQLYGMDYRTDPRFERYDSSGWAYSASEETLMVKMKHKLETESIKIFFTGAATPAPGPIPAEQIQ